MKNLIKMVLLLSLTSNIQASTQCGNNGDVAYRACEKLGAYEKMCKNAVGENHADEGAVSVCLTASNAPGNFMYACITGTIGKIYSRAELTKCMNIPSSYSRINCITDSGRGFIRSGDDNLNDGYKALTACEDLRMGAYESMCKNTVGENHADEGAVAVCLTASTAPDNFKYGCIKGTLNKKFSRSELRKCMNISNPMSRINCISNNGRAVVPNICN